MHVVFDTNFLSNERRDNINAFYHKSFTKYFPTLTYLYYRVNFPQQNHDVLWLQKFKYSMHH